MFNSQVHRSLWLALAAAALCTAAGCSNQATNEPVTTAKKAAPAKPAAAKPAAVKPVAAKGAVNKAPEPTAMVTVPKGTEISAAVGQTLATDKNKVGDTFAASLTSPIKVEGKTVIPKGAQVTGRIVKIKKNELKVTLASVVVHGKSYDLETNSVAGSKNQAKNNAKDAEKAKTNKDVTVLAAHSKVTFKLAKPVTIPGKG
jgi:glucose/arabinose dehydrogenase